METRQTYYEALDALKQEILQMGVLVEEALRKAVRSLVEQDEPLAAQVVAGDEVVDRTEIDIEDKCVVLIATEQPVAGDLRRLVTSMKTVTQLERMADHAVHVAKAARRLADQTYVKPLVDIPRMGAIAAQMLHDVLTALVENDAEKASEVARRDEEIDNLHSQITRELMTYAMGNPRSIDQILQLLYVSRFLERFADHVTNISEWIVYSETARHVDLNA